MSFGKQYRFAYLGHAFCLTISVCLFKAMGFGKNSIVVLTMTFGKQHRRAYLGHEFCQTMSLSQVWSHR